MAALQKFYQDPSIGEAQRTAEVSATTAAEYQSAAALLPSKLKDAVQGKLDYNKDIIEAKNRAMAEYFKAPSAAREKYQDIWNPFSREKLVAEERAQAYLPLANLTDILKERRGGIADIIEAGTGASQADVLAKESAAGITRQTYQDKLTLASLLSDAAYKEGQLAKGGGDGIGGLLELLLGKGLGEDVGLQAEPTEAKPQTSDAQIQRMQNSPEVMWRSPKGQWMFDFISNDWVPIID